MIFDQFCGIAERYLPEMVDTLERCKLFIFEIDPVKEGKTKPVNTEEFFLPYQYTAVEDDSSCLIIIDDKKELTGLDCIRVFIEIMPFPEEYKEINHYLGGKYMISAGFFSEVKDSYVDGKKNQQWTANISSRSRVYSKEFGYHEELDRFMNRADNLSSQHSVQNVIATIEQINYLNTSENFILETSPAKAPKKKRKKGYKIPRTHQRPVYTILSPNKIRKKMGISKPIHDRKSPIPHERRRHIKYLSNERYSYSNGEKIEPMVIPSGPRKGENYYKRVIVPSTWIGTTENTINGKRYRVITDR